MGRPRVIVHFAQTLDGRLALAGQMTSLSTAEGRRCAHASRAAADAVLVGVNTVRIDDPRLTVREVPRTHDPLRIVLASGLDVPHASRIFGEPSTTGKRAMIIGAKGRDDATRRTELEAAGADVVMVGADADGMVRLDQALEALAARGIQNLLVEGGGRVLTSFFREGLVDSVEIGIAMTLLGAPATPTLGPLGIDVLAKAPRLTRVTVERLGTNVLLRGDVVRGSSDA